MRPRRAPQLQLLLQPLHAGLLRGPLRRGGQRLRGAVGQRAPAGQRAQRAAKRLLAARAADAPGTPPTHAARPHLVDRCEPLKVVDGHLQARVQVADEVALRRGASGRGARRGAAGGRARSAARRFALNAPRARAGRGPPPRAHRRAGWPPHSCLAPRSRLGPPGIGQVAPPPAAPPRFAAPPRPGPAQPPPPWRVRAGMCRAPAWYGPRRVITPIKVHSPR